RHTRWPRDWSSDVCSSDLKQQNTDVRIESFEPRRIDSRTMVVMYTAVLPDTNGVIRQPVVATMVREPGRSGWRVASYTAENAARSEERRVGKEKRCGLFGD